MKSLLVIAVLAMLSQNAAQNFAERRARAQNSYQAKLTGCRRDYDRAIGYCRAGSTGNDCMARADQHRNFCRQGAENFINGEMQRLERGETNMRRVHPGQF